MIDRGRLRATARLWWRMMRMQRVTREGWFYVGFTIVVGAAAINTGNNLLHLVLGLQLSLILLSALLSESALRGVRVLRRLPRRAVAGEPVAVELEIENRKARLASYSLIVTEVDGPAEGAAVLVQRLGPGARVQRGYRLTIPRRGMAAFGRVRVTTRFPFGLFEKSREQDLGGVLPVHPSGGAIPPKGRALSAPGAGERPEPYPGTGSEFHGLRSFRSGDDPRSVHWRSTAKTGRPVVIERERERRRVVTLLVDTRGMKDVDGIADSAIGSARRFVGEGCDVGLAWPGGDVVPAPGSAQLLQLGDALAALHPAPPSAPPPRVHRGAQGFEVEPIAPAAGAEAPAIEAGRGRAERGAKGVTLAQTQRLSLLAASLIGFASLAISGELAGWAVATFVGAAVINLALREGAARQVRSGANLLAVGALVLLGLQVWFGATTIIVAAPTFAVVLAASRLLGRKGPADDALLLLAALLMLAGGAALTGELAYGLCFAAFAVTGTVALCLTHLRREVEDTEGGRESRVSPGLISALGGLSLAVLVGSALVFVLFPRVSAGMLRVAGQDHATGGTTDRIELGGVGVIKDDPTPVMRVRFPAGPPGGEPYWRTVTFQRWTGKGWSRGDPKRVPVAGVHGVWKLGRAPVETTIAEVEWLGSEPAIPLPGEPVELRIPRKRRAVPPILLTGEDGSLEFAGSVEPRFTITAGRSGVGDEPLAGGGYLEVPADLDPRIAAMAAPFRDRGDPLAIAQAMVEMLGQGYRYTRELPGQTPDPLAHFLFERKAGHCEYFASALTMLLRSAGIPARVAAGYFGAHWVEAGGYFVVREGDAHAWTEAWIPGRGWTRFDATPPDDRAGTAEGLVASAVELLDLLRYWWAGWILDFDRSAQIGLATSVAEAFSGREGAGQGLSRAARVGVQAVLVAAAAALAYRTRRRWLVLRGRNLPRAQRDAALLYRAIKRDLRRKGARLPPGATGSEWAAAAERLAPANAPSIREAIEAYEAARFGNRAIPTSKLKALRRSALAKRARTA